MPSVRFPPKNDVTDCGGNVGLWETENAARMAVLGHVTVAYVAAKPCLYRRLKVREAHLATDMRPLMEMRADALQARDHTGASA